MAKDILKYHAVYWPAFLMAAGLPLPKKELIHGWWLKDEKKMSKSSGNVLDPHILLKFFSADAIRYFLMREAPIGADGNFSHEGFINRVNTDLTNDWANLVSRTTGMIEKYFNNTFSQEAGIRKKRKRSASSIIELEPRVLDLFDHYQFNRGLEDVFAIRQPLEPLYRRRPALEPGQRPGRPAATGRCFENPGPGHPEHQYAPFPGSARNRRQGTAGFSIPAMELGWKNCPRNSPSTKVNRFSRAWTARFFR